MNANEREYEQPMTTGTGGRVPAGGAGGGKRTRGAGLSPGPRPLPRFVLLAPQRPRRGWINWPEAREVAVVFAQGVCAFAAVGAMILAYLLVGSLE